MTDEGTTSLAARVVFKVDQVGILPAFDPEDGAHDALEDRERPVSETG